MVKTIFLLSTCLLLNLTLAAQNQVPDDEDRKLKLNSVIGIGRSTFHTGQLSPSNFPTLELRAGVGVAKSIDNIFAFYTRFVVGAKFKREALFPADPAFNRLDEVVSSRNHYFWEIPLMVQAKVSPRFGVQLGTNLRHFFPNNRDVDFLTASYETGVIVGVKYRISEPLNVGLEYYYGLTKMMKSGSTIDGSDVGLHARNQFAQVTVEYAFWK